MSDRGFSGWVVLWSAGLLSRRQGDRLAGWPDGWMGWWLGGWVPGWLVGWMAGLQDIGWLGDWRAWWQGGKLAGWQGGRMAGWAGAGWQCDRVAGQQGVNVAGRFIGWAVYWLGGLLAGRLLGVYFLLIWNFWYDRPVNKKSMNSFYMYSLISRVNFTNTSSASRLGEIMKTL